MARFWYRLMLMNGALLLNSNSCNKGSTKQEPDDSFFHAKLSCFQGMKTVILEINTKHLKLPKFFSNNDLFGEESHPYKSSVKPAETFRQKNFCPMRNRWNRKSFRYPIQVLDPFSLDLIASKDLQLPTRTKPNSVASIFESILPL